MGGGSRERGIFPVKNPSVWEALGLDLTTGQNANIHRCNSFLEWLRSAANNSTVPANPLSLTPWYA